MTRKKIEGIVELRPSVFDECPDYATLGLRTTAGKFFEVFLPTAMVTNNPEQFEISRHLTLWGGEHHTEPSTGGVGEYVRCWPAEVSG